MHYTIPRGVKQVSVKVWNNRTTTLAEQLELAWKNAAKTTCFSDLANRLSEHKRTRSEGTPQWTEYAFPDGSSLRTYGRGANHRYEVYPTRRCRNA